jgi:hypothetical protein
VLLTLQQRCETGAGQRYAFDTGKGNGEGAGPATREGIGRGRAHRKPNARRREKLGALIEWRNAIAHGDIARKQEEGALTPPEVLHKAAVPVLMLRSHCEA